MATPIIVEQAVQQGIDISNKAIAGTSTATVGAWLWTALGNNYQAIGAACAIAGLFLTFCAVSVNIYFQIKANKNK